MMVRKMGDGQGERVRDGLGGREVDVLGRLEEIF